VPSTCETANELRATVTTDRMIRSPAATMICELLIPPNPVRGRPGAVGYAYAGMVATGSGA
jgi:hypothetical protein